VANEFSREERDRNRRDLEAARRRRRADRRETSLNAGAARELMQEAASSDIDPKDPAFKAKLNRLNNLAGSLSDAAFQKEIEKLDKARIQGLIFSSLRPLTAEERELLEKAKKKQKAKGGCAVIAVAGMGVIGAAIPLVRAILGA